MPLSGREVISNTRLARLVSISSPPSVGGCSLLMPSDMPELRPGLVLYGVQVQLDPATAFVAGIELHHIASMDGEGGQRIGCAWQGLDPIAERALQCYVNQTQKQQRLQPGP